MPPKNNPGKGDTHNPPQKTRLPVTGHPRAEGEEGDTNIADPVAPGTQALSGIRPTRHTTRRARRRHH